MVGMIEALRREHAEMSELLDLIDQQINDQDGADLELLHEVLDYCLTYPDQYHHPKEDLIYRAMCRHERALAPAIEDLEAEHEELSILTRELAGLVEDARARGLARPPGLKGLGQSLLELYRQHIAKEEHWLFPDALELLTAEEWADIESEVSDPTDPLFREQAAQRLQSLANRAVP